MRRKMTSEVRRGVVKWSIQAVLGWLGYGAVLFLVAGRLDWIWGWMLLGQLGAFLAGHVLILVPINPELLAARQRGLRDERAKRWDRWIAGLAGGVFPIASWILAGLDLRNGWSGGMPLAVHLGGAAVSAAGYALFLWALASNAFFAETVQIQAARGHTVATDGPYRFVRHPGYVGAILSMISAPFLLGSLWALIPAGLAVGGYVLRTALEDRTLQEELEGYPEYARRVRFRLLPGVW